MGTLDLSKLPDSARFESSCQIATSPKKATPSILPIRRDNITIYLTSSGEVCLHNKLASELSPSPIFSLRSVKDVNYTPKVVKAPFLFHAGTLYIVFVGLFYLLLSFFASVDYVINFEQYYNSVPEIDPSQATSTAAAAAPFVAIAALLWIGPLMYVENRIRVWSDCERLDFILDNEEQISFFGRYPGERRLNFHKYAYVSFMLILVVVTVTIPQLILEVLMIIFIALPLLILLFRLKDWVFGESGNPDENKGTVQIRELEDFYNDVNNLPRRDLDSNEGRRKATFNFVLLVDRLSNQVESLSARLEVYEKALDEATKEKWRYTLRVPEVDQGLNQIRKCSERILYPRVTNLGHKIGPRTGLGDLKSILEKNKAIDSNALSDIEVILAKTSPGSHATTGYAESDDDYIMALRALANLVEWHFDHPVEAPVVLPEAN